MNQFSTKQIIQLLGVALILTLGAFVNEAQSRALQDTSTSIPMSKRFEQWIARHGRVYKDIHEKHKRFQIFQQNVGQVESFNSAPNQPYKLAINQFADLTNEEFKASRTGFKGHVCSPILGSSSFRYANVTVPPSTMDWRQKGAVTPIKDQGQCGMF